MTPKQVERPIIFSSEMVRAILDDRKTMTRRILNRQPHKGSCDFVMCRPADYGFGRNNYQRWGVMYKPPKNEWLDDDHPLHEFIACPHGQPGDRLWVRETWYDRKERIPDMHDLNLIRYDLPEDEDYAYRFYKRPSIHMPRWASRITLEIVDVKVERLQEISEEDIKAEGIWRDVPVPELNNLEYFKELWNYINAKRGYGWDMNPFVWAITFRRIKP